MYSYMQSTGLPEHDGIALLTGSAGHGACVNNPAIQDRHDIGPLPQGLCAMTALVIAGHAADRTSIWQGADHELKVVA
jgi:hypothetical protein